MNATVRLRTGALMPRLDALEEGLATGWDPRGLVMLLMALGFVLMRWHLHRHPGLLQEQVDEAGFRQGTRYSIAMGPVAYAAGAGLAWVNGIAAFVCYAAIALYFVFPQATRTPGRGEPPAPA